MVKGAKWAVPGWRVVWAASSVPSQVIAPTHVKASELQDIAHRQVGGWTCFHNAFAACRTLISKRSKTQDSPRVATTLARSILFGSVLSFAQNCSPQNWPIVQVTLNQIQYYYIQIWQGVACRQEYDLGLPSLYLALKNHNLVP